MTSELSTAGWMFESWCASLSEVLGSLTGTAPQVSRRMAQPATDQQEALATADQLWWEQPLSLAGQPRIWVGTPAATWRELGARVLRARGLQGATDANLRSAFQEALGQALAKLATRLGQRLGQTVRCEGGREILEAPEAGLCADIEVGLEETPLPVLRMVLTEDLLRALEPDAPPQQLAAAGTAAPPAPAEQPPRTLDLLMEVELPVSVSFGRAELPLKDVLKLTTGSIVELNRTVEEPVELIVNNCVIARGEVVVVDGNYGVRIKQIISPQERLRTLR